jgi:methylaspartate ammonia-lyase
MVEKQNRLLNALNAKYTAEMMDALARLEVYITSPVAIGEHPQHTEEMDKLIEQYTNAKDKDESLMIMKNELGF